MFPAQSFADVTVTVHCAYLQAASRSPGPARRATPTPSLVSAIPQRPYCQSTLRLLASSELCPLP